VWRMVANQIRLLPLVGYDHKSRHASGHEVCVKERNTIEPGNLRPSKQMSGDRGMEGTGTQTRLFSLRSIILHVARFDFGADSPNLKVTIWSPGVVQDKLWSP
jgi:hypothetical protein